MRYPGTGKGLPAQHANQYMPDCPSFTGTEMDSPEDTCALSQAREDHDVQSHGLLCLPMDISRVPCPDPPLCPAPRSLKTTPEPLETFREYRTRTSRFKAGSDIRTSIVLARSGNRRKSRQLPQAPAENKTDPPLAGVVIFLPLGSGSARDHAR